WVQMRLQNETQRSVHNETARTVQSKTRGAGEPLPGAIGNEPFRSGQRRATASARRVVMDASENPEARRASIGARRNPQSAEAILTAAEAILREHGLAGFSIEAVARRARAGKPTIYRWWPNRTALMLAVYERQKMAVRSVDTGSIEEDSLQFLEALFAYWRDTGAGQV